MAVHPVFSEERRVRIVELVRERKSLSVHELCEAMQVSPATVRADLRDLDRQGRLIRTHGGAIEKSRAGFEQISSKRVTENLKAKRAIAVEAIRWVEDGDTVVLDTGTTTLELARRLHARRALTVVTNDLDIARVLEEAAGVQVVVLGGALRKGYHCTVGPAGIRTAQELRVDKAFMATNSLNLDVGATTPDLHQAETKQAMIAMAAKVLLLCDHSKIGRASFARFASPEDIDVLVTDALEPRERAAWQQRGVEVVLPTAPRQADD